MVTHNISQSSVQHLITIVMTFAAMPTASPIALAGVITFTLSMAMAMAAATVAEPGTTAAMTGLPAVTYHTYVERRMYTHACLAQPSWRREALVFAQHARNHTRYTVYAGYLIYTMSRSPIMLSPIVSYAVLTDTSPLHALRMAHRLVHSFATRLAPFLCDMRVGDVARAIARAASFAAVCLRSDHPFCFPFFQVAVCERRLPGVL